MKRETRHISTTGKINFLVTGLLIALLTAAFSFNVFGQTETASRISLENNSKDSGVINDGSKKVKSKKADLQEDRTAPIDSDELISGTTYPMTVPGVTALEDMSSGTTTLVGASADDFGRRRGNSVECYRQSIRPKYFDNGRSRRI
jgi:hypothetical protein